MPRPLCPINLHCNYQISELTGRAKCPNHKGCSDLGVAWEVPYERQIIGGMPALVVKSSGFRTPNWEKKSYSPNRAVIKCYIPSGYYPCPNYDDYHEIELSRRIKQAWLEVGWLAAVPLEVVACNPDED